MAPVRYPRKDAWPGEPWPSHVSSMRSRPILEAGCMGNRHFTSPRALAWVAQSVLRLEASSQETRMRPIIVLVGQIAGGSNGAWMLPQH
jgi:hypothetical protein